jgi:hypothetical protein
MRCTVPQRAENDLVNPTSNPLYQRLGFLPVEERVVFVFGS